MLIYLSSISNGIQLTFLKRIVNLLHFVNNQGVSTKAQKIKKFKFNRKTKFNIKNTFGTQLNIFSNNSDNIMIPLKSTTSFEDTCKAEIRFWQNTNLQRRPSGAIENDNAYPFTLLSYNILAQDLIEKHNYLYEKHDPNILNWNHRLNSLINEIKSLNPEILCLQEVQESHLSELHTRLDNNKYDYVYKKIPGERTDGCAIFFDKNVVQILSKNSVEYFQPNVYHLDRQNVALIVKFCLKSNSNVCFIVSTTHLLYNPRRQDVRLAQIQILLAELDRLSIHGFNENDEPQRIPIILTGDFNFEPNSAPYRLITEGNLQYEHLTNWTLEESRNSDKETLTGKLFLTPELGVTDSCQHIDLMTKKYKGEPRIQNKEENRPFLYVKDKDEEITKNSTHLFQTGKLSHALNLISAYEHEGLDGNIEATTYQNRWLKVDYIFFSIQSNSQTTKSNSLGHFEIISRFKLPYINEFELDFNIPNKFMGSDHFPLAVKLLLVKNI